MAKKLKLGTDLINAVKEIILNTSYPVGRIIVSIDNVNPGTYLGGTWVSWGTGRVPVGVDTSQTEFNTVEKTGGEKKHTLTISEMPSHSHSFRLAWGGTDPFNGLGYATNISGDFSDASKIQNTGGGQAHNNLQPYITCYMWKRTA